VLVVTVFAVTPNPHMTLSPLRERRGFLFTRRARQPAQGRQERDPGDVSAGTRYNPRFDRYYLRSARSAPIDASAKEASVARTAEASIVWKRYSVPLTASHSVVGPCWSGSLIIASTPEAGRLAALTHPWGSRGRTAAVSPVSVAGLSS
jgi:hypothetical protein